MLSLRRPRTSALPGLHRTADITRRMHHQRRAASNRHSAVAFDLPCGVGRGFLPRGLSDTCPQAAAHLRRVACSGRCPTTLNRSGRFVDPKREELGPTVGRLWSGPTGRLWVGLRQPTTWTRRLEPVIRIDVAGQQPLAFDDPGNQEPSTAGRNVEANEQMLLPGASQLPCQFRALGDVEQSQVRIGIHRQRQRARQPADSAPRKAHRLREAKSTSGGVQRIGRLRCRACRCRMPALCRSLQCAATP